MKSKQIKKVTSFLLSCVMVITLVGTKSLRVLAADTKSDTGDLTTKEIIVDSESDFTFDETTGTITGYRGAGGDIVIPSTIGGVTVSTVGVYAFKGNTSITSVSLPESVTTIQGSAFESCTELKSVDMPGVITILGWAFFNSNKLTNIQMPQVVTIGEFAFMSCTELINVYMPKVTTIAEGAFSACVNLTEVKMPEVIEVKANAFDGCTILTSVEMPKATTIGSFAFNSCGSLKSIQMPEVTLVGNSAFKDCTSLTSVNLRKVTGINAYAFQGCTSLESVEIPKNDGCVVEVNAFDYCTKLTKVTLYYGSNPIDGITITEWEEFVGWKMNSSTTDIVKQVTEGWVSNETDSRQLFKPGFTFDEATKTITNYRGTDEVIVIPSQINGVEVTTIGDNAFYGNTSIKSVQMPNSITSIGVDAFRNCSNLTSVDMPMVTSVGDSAFRSCISLKNIEMPKLTSIGNYGFRGCTSLSTIKMTTVTSIGSYAFKNCTNLTSIEISKEAAVGTDTFIGCTNLIKVTIYYGDEVIDKITIDEWKAFVSSRMGETIIGQITGMYVSNNEYSRNLDDTVGPEITINGESNIEIALGSNYTELGAIAKDAYENKDVEVKISGEINVNIVGQYIITYTAIDGSRNISTVTRTVNVVNKKGPVITLNGSETINIDVYTKYDEQGATARDDTNGILQVVTTGKVDTHKVGSYIITYTATDSRGNTTTATRTVNVVDTKAPIMKLVGPDTITIIKGCKYIELGAVALDKVDLFVEVSISGSVNTNNVGEYNIVYTATDKSGNTSKLIRTIKVVNWF